MSNTDEELDAELLKLSVPDPTVAPARKELEAEQPEINHEDVSPQVTETAKATAEPAQGVIGKPSDAVLNFQKSFMLWTEEEKQQMYPCQRTPTNSSTLLCSTTTNTPRPVLQQPSPAVYTRHLIRVELI